MHNITRITNPEKLRRINNALTTTIKKNVGQLLENEIPSLREKIFLLDHTAEVLENYRKVKENEIFNHILHGEREKKAFLKKESRKP